MSSLNLKLILILVLIPLIFSACQSTVSSDLTIKKWHKLSLSFEGPQTSEEAEINPFLSYRLTATFTNGDRKYTVPGFYAADGQAAETSATEGKVWKVHFVPDTEGVWDYQISFRKGENISISDDINAGESAGYFDGQTGSFNVLSLDGSEEGFQSKGKIAYTGGRYLQFAETGAYFLKGGADSPENFLAYHEFDGPQPQHEKLHESREGEAAEAPLHKYEPHIKDWKEGDPTWQDGKGKGIIGGLNYLSSKGMNSVYFLTMNVRGDGNDVWPWTTQDERFRFDCSKLDQWEILFDHMDNLGLMLHIVTQETENELLLDNGDTDIQRKLYYRELIARFSHHLGVTWNLGEENGPANFTPNGQTDEQRKAMASYLKAHDPYQNFVALHTHAAQKPRDSILLPLLGFPDLDGPSMQVGRTAPIHEETKRWLKLSKESGKQWVCFLDEIGPHTLGVMPDNIDPNHDTVRYEALWGNLMAGGAGAEWYFGYKFPNDDLGCEDWRSRDNMWDQTRYALDFFQKYLPFYEMENANGLATAKEVYVYAKSAEVYALYIPAGVSTQLDLQNASNKSFSIKWYDPKNGGKLQDGSIGNILGGKFVEIGDPPSNLEQDWVVLLSQM